MRFVDTNVLLYAVSTSPAEAAKAATAVAVLAAPDLALSVQVLQEFYVQATRPSAAAPIRHDDAVAFIAALGRFPVLDVTRSVVVAAMAACRRWQLSYWDAAIIEAARALGCGTVLSEDLQDGQDFDGVQVVNPFLS